MKLDVLIHVIRMTQNCMMVWFLKWTRHDYKSWWPIIRINKKRIWFENSTIDMDRVKALTELDDDSKMTNRISSSSRGSIPQNWRDQELIGIWSGRPQRIQDSDHSDSTFLAEDDFKLALLACQHLYRVIEPSPFTTQTRKINVKYILWTKTSSWLPTDISVNNH